MMNPHAANNNAAWNYDWQNNDITNLQTISLTAMANTGLGTAGGGVNPIAVDCFFRELSTLFGRGRIANLMLRLRGRDPRTEQMRRELESRLGVSLPLDGRLLKALREEVSRYKWLEAERAGHDIWRSRDPRDPDGTALREWFRQYYGEWYLANVRRQLV